MITSAPLLGSGKRWWPCCLMAMTLLLSACGTTVEDPQLSNPGFVGYTSAVLSVREWALSGRLTARQNNDSERVSLNWRQNGDEFDITLWGTLGLGSTRIFGTDRGLVVEKANEAPVQLPNLQALSRQYLAFDFPAAYLEYWARGLAVPGLESTLNFNETNLLTTMSQLDPGGRRWDLQFDRYRPAGDFNFPGRIRVTSGPLQLILLVDDWQLASTRDN